jgi:hypothetical protein
MNSVLNLILSHQSALAVAKMIAHWSTCVPRDSILIAYGGSKSEFDAIDYPQKFFVEDARLRTRDHQREFQSYTELFRAAAAWIDSQSRKIDFVHFAEYDLLPLVSDLNRRQIDRLKTENADVLAYHVYRVDDTSSAHYLYHIDNPEFRTYWPRISRRLDRHVVLSCFGTGTFWTREGFCAVASAEEPTQCYMEIYLPTLAHHLGFRVRDLPDQNRFVRAHEHGMSLEEARQCGAWTLHPLKRLWTS